MRKAVTGSCVCSQNLLKPIEAYDALAPYYGSYVERRRSYLRIINDIVISRVGHAASLLDVGAGDGSRAIEIGRSIEVGRIVLVEPSAGMRAYCPEGLEVLPCDVLEIPEDTPSFEVITCLWNVLGHIQEAQQRLQAFARLRTLLLPGGMIFLDVSHRYNAASYGWMKTVARLAGDIFFPSEKNGDVIVSWDAGGRRIHTQSHVFTHGEMKKLVGSAGLKILMRWVVNYETGAECGVPFGGHLLYQLTSV
jgi:2-polyprenyl-3-methyl-5-hydroxy-6-metoxy-1,4-benzoquinol methylase